MARLLARHRLSRAALLAAVALSALSALTACQSTPADQVATCEGHAVTIAGTPGDDRLVGTDGDDVMAGGRGSDRIWGKGGNDIICGGSDDDRIRGDAGDDELYGGDDHREIADTEYYEWYGDVLDGGAGNDRLEPGFDHGIGGETVVDRDRVTFSTAAAGVVIDLAAGTATGDGNDTLIGPVTSVRGSAHDDTIRGTEGPDEIMGGLGADSVYGLGGNDKIGTGLIAASNPRVEDASRNRAFGGPGNDEIYGSSGNELLVGGPGGDSLTGLPGRDRLIGGAGNDWINDDIVTGTGQLIDGGDGVDEMNMFLVWNAPADAPLGKPSAAGGTLDLDQEQLRATVGDKTLTVPVRDIENASGSYGPWTLIGNDEDNQLITGFDKTPVVIRAGGGNDRVMGSFKHDVLDGGLGRDMLIWSPGEDRVSNFEKIRK